MMPRLLLALVVSLIWLGAPRAAGLEFDATTAEQGDKNGGSTARIESIGAEEAEKLAEQLWSEPLVVPELEQDEPSETSATSSAEEAGEGGDVDEFRAALEGKAMLAVEASWPDPPRNTGGGMGMRGSQHESPRFGLKPLLFLGFNQKVHPKEILKSVFLKSSADEVPVRRVRLRDVPEDSPVRKLAERFGAEKSVIFRPRSALDADTTYIYGLEKGAPGAQEESATVTRREFRFETVAPLEIGGTSCRGKRPCKPGQGIFISFNNVIDPESFKLSMIELPDELSGAAVRLQGPSDVFGGQGGSIYVQADTRPEQTYELTISGQVRDVHGHRLGEDVTIRAHFGSVTGRFLSRTRSLTVLRPSEKLEVRTQNIKKMRLEVARVEPDAFEQYRRWRKRYRPYGEFDPPFRRSHNVQELTGPPVIVDREVDIGGEKNEVVDSGFGPSEWMDKGGRHFVVRMTPTEFYEGTEPRGRRQPRSMITWLQVTDLGIDALDGAEELQVWVTRLSTGAPVEDALVSLSPDGASAEADEHGLATFGKSSPGGYEAIEAELGDDIAILPFRAVGDAEITHYQGGTYRHATQPVHMVTDRAVYAPGDTIHVAGWIRDFDPQQHPRLALPSIEGGLEYWVSDRDGMPLAEGTADATDHAGFGFSVDLPEDTPAGKLRVGVGLPGRVRSSAEVEVGKPRSPFLAVSVDAPPGPTFVGDEVTVAAHVRRLSGAIPALAKAKWRLESTLARFKPWGWNEFEFGDRTPGFTNDKPDAYDTSRTIDFERVASGTHELDVRLKDSDPPVAMELNVQASIDDGRGREVKSEVSRLVHPAGAYVGLRVPDQLLEEGRTFEVEAVTIDPDGRPLASRPVEVIAERMVWRSRRGSWRRVSTSTERCRFKSGETRHTCSFEAKKGGAYRVTARVKDAKRRVSMTRLQVYVPGAPSETISHRPDIQRLQVVPDKDVYQPGDVAELRVLAPFDAKVGVIGHQQQGTLESQVFQMDGRATTVRFEITEAHRPNVLLKAEVVAGADSAGTSWPAMALGWANLKVSNKSQTLDVSLGAGPAKDSEANTIDIAARIADADGAPVEDADVAIFIVEEAALAVGAHEFGDLLETFYPKSRAGIGGPHLRQWRQHPLPLRPGQGQKDKTRTLEINRYSTGTWPRPTRSQGRVGCCIPSRRSQEPAEEPVNMPAKLRGFSTARTGLATDENGEVHGKVVLPERPAQYRIFAMAADGATRFGSGELSVSSAEVLPGSRQLSFTADAPRELGVGEGAKVRILVENHGAAAATAEVAVRAAGVETVGSTARRVDVPAGERVVVSFSIDAPQAGPGVVEVAWSDGDTIEHDRIELVVE